MVKDPAFPIYNVVSLIGSILGHLFYPIYVNDTPNSCNGNILSFADDTTLCMSNSNLQALFLEGNETVYKYFHWFCANGLSLNLTKTKCIVLRPHQQPCNFTGQNVAINNNILKRLGNDCEEKSKFGTFSYLLWNIGIGKL